MVKTIMGLLTVLFMAVGLNACGDSKPQQQAQVEAASDVSVSIPTKVRVACTEISHAMLEPGLPWMAEHGLDVELVLMDGNVNIIRAVNDGSVEAALGVHQKFMENFNAQNNGQLAMVKPYPFTTGIGFYSDRYQMLDALPEEARIAIMNDAMNMDRGLRMLRDAGLIGLDEQKAGGYTLLDITENPKRVEFIDMDQSQTVRSLQDVDGAVVFFTHMRNAGKDFRAYIVRDQDADRYPMGIVVRLEDVDNPWAITLAEAVRSEPVRAEVAQRFDGVFEYFD